MFSTYTDFAPVVILLTLVLSFVIGRKITRESIQGIDGRFAAFGFLFGLFMTCMNLFYTSKELFLLSPVIALSCVFYLRYRSGIEIQPDNSSLKISDRNSTILSIIWWIFICAAVLTYHFSEIYTRHPLFFVFIAGAVAILAVQIIASVPKKITTAIYIVKILIVSVILRYSAYFVSIYPIGSDPWAHQEYISYFLDFGRVDVLPEFVYYYVYYPIAHLYAVVSILLGSVSTHDAMFLLGVVLTLSTIVTFLIVRILTGNIQLALISMLVLNFTDAYIQWSIQVIAMSFAIALYAFVLFFAIRMVSKPEGKNTFTIMMLVFLSIIVWTHTISAFIALVSLCALVAGYILYEILYNRNFFSFKSRNVQVLAIPLIFLVTIIISHWMDPSYSFFNMIFQGLIHTFSKEVEFLSATDLSNLSGTWEQLLQPLGFCIYVCFGIIGTFYCLANKERAGKYFPLFFLVLVLFSVRYVFPIFGMRNIIPDRWPSFAFIVFALFIGVGIFSSMNLLKQKRTILCAVATLFFIGSFLMITNPVTNGDSPILGDEIFQKLIWTESEMNMYIHMDALHNGVICADSQTAARPFKTFLKKNNVIPYPISSDGMIDEDRLPISMIVWRTDSLTRPERVIRDDYTTSMLLGDQFLKYLDYNRNCIISTNCARCYSPKYDSKRFNY